MTTSVAVADREGLRREHRVALVNETQEGTAAADLPAGVYGYTSSPVLASPLFATERHRNFEVHRLDDGPAVVGYVTDENARSLAESAGPVEIVLFPHVEGDARAIVSISYDRIAHHRQYLVRNASAIALRVNGRL